MDNVTTFWYAELQRVGKRIHKSVRAICPSVRNVPSCAESTVKCVLQRILWGTFFFVFPLAFYHVMLSCRHSKPVSAP